MRLLTGSLLGTLEKLWFCSSDNVRTIVEHRLLSFSNLQDDNYRDSWLLLLHVI